VRAEDEAERVVAEWLACGDGPEFEVAMFWTQRLKDAGSDTDDPWVLSYGDLMSLLLVIFVMIAAMSELRAGDRFGRISSGVRQAFGFAAPAAANANAAGYRPPTLLERLEQAGFRRESTVQLIGPDDEKLAPVDVIVAEKSITLRIAGHSAFARHSAAIEPAGRGALERLAGYMARGKGRIEVRGHAGDGLLPADVPFRDGMDLSYARARAVADVLVQRGVASERLVIAALGDREPLTGKAAAVGIDNANVGLTQPMPDGVNRRIEIVVQNESE
jgi:chemotaxis protein MotB